MVLIQKGELIFLRLLLPLILGITLGFSLPAQIFIYQLVVWLTVFCMLTLWLTVICYKRFKIYLTRWKPGVVLHLLVFFSGVALTLTNNPELSEKHFSSFDDEELIVAIRSEPKLSNNILRFETEVQQGFSGNSFSKREGSLMIALKLNNTQSYHFGDELLIRGDFNVIDPPLNPYEFDYKTFLANHGISRQAFINESQLKLIGKHKANFLVDKALELRKSYVLKYQEYIHDKQSASVASTLILGYKAELSREVLSAYSKTGTMHVLSVSGMHVGIVFYILNAMLWFMNRNKKLRILRAVIIISLIWFYSLITGFSPSVCRAALMLSMYVLGKAVYRSSNSYNLVATSAVFLLLYNPYFLLDVGFQLSYLAVLGLIYFYPKIYHLFYIRNWIGDKIWSYVALSCAAQLATFPLAMYYFHQFPVYFLLSNLFIVLPVIVIMYLGIAFLFIPWDWALKSLGLLLEKGIMLMDEGLFFIEKLPFANIIKYDSLAFYLSVYASIALLAIAFQHRNKRMLYASLLVGLILISYQSATHIISQKKHFVTFYGLRKNTAFSIFSGKEAYVFSDLDSADKSLAFFVQPCVEAYASRSRYLNLDNSLENNLVFFKENFLRFRDWRMMIWNKSLDNYSFQKQFEVDVVLLSGRPQIKLTELVKNVKFKLLMIDATNADYMIKNWVDEASALSLNYYVLKKNPAYSIPLE
ncbi:MAG: ComEC family competence protein [Sphingobacteriaceae bacterium]|nr:ComEC family competence protein [Sphingobacteriaceae bacterium]